MPICDNRDIQEQGTGNAVTKEHPMHQSMNTEY